MISTTKTSLKYTVTAILFAVASTFSVSAQPAGEAKTEKEAKAEKFDAGKMIMEHIGDAHEWHIAGEGAHRIALPLPVILYTANGLDVFMSSKFHNADNTYQGKNNYKQLENNHIVILSSAGEIDKEATAKLWDISISKNVASLFFSAICILLIFGSISATYGKNPNVAPTGVQSFIEPLIIFIRDEVAKPSIGEKHYAKFVPFLLTVFFFILFNNLLGLIPVLPGGANLTGNIAITMVLALFTFAITTYNGNKHYWKHIFAMPGVPKAVLFILTPIEILGVFLKPFVLMIRLFANMAAGHIIALSFFAIIFIFGEMSWAAGMGVSLVSVAFTVFMGLLELLVAFLQAYVFVLLSAMYFGMALEEGHEAHGEHH